MTLPPDIQWADDRLEAYLDGELSPDEAARVERVLDASPPLRAALGAAVRVQDELRLMPQPLAPRGFAEGVLAEVTRRREATLPGRLRLAASRAAQATSEALRATWRPSLAAAMLLLLVLSGVLFGRSTPAPAAESAEVRQATDEVKWVLAYLSQVGREAGAVVREDVLEQHVVRPVQSALGTILEDPASAPDPDAVP